MSLFEEENREEMDFQLCFVQLLKQYSVILNKSQIPNIKEKKEIAIKSFLKEYEEKYGVKINDQQLMKKVNNMKNKVKAKIDINKTGNRPIKLLPWERHFADILAENYNPTMTKISGATTIGFIEAESKVKKVNEDVQEVEQFVKENTMISKRPKKRHVNENIFETNETKSLTTEELQRLVLVEQLQLTRIQKDYYSTKMKKIATYVDNNKEYSVL